MAILELSRHHVCVHDQAITVCIADLEIHAQLRVEPQLRIPHARPMVRIPHKRFRHMLIWVWEIVWPDTSTIVHIRIPRTQWPSHQNLRQLFQPPRCLYFRGCMCPICILIISRSASSHKPLMRKAAVSPCWPESEKTVRNHQFQSWIQNSVTYAQFAESRCLGT